MLYNAKNGQVNIGSSVMDYIKFGKGEKNIIMIPGLGDGLKTVKGLALPMAVMYRQFAKDFTVWMFSRKQPLEADATTRTMARDLKTAMDELGIDCAHIMGVSQGGMIAQWLTIDFPQKVKSLALVVTLAKQNKTVQSVVGSWIEMAQNDDFKTLTIDNFEKSYTDKYLKNYRPFYPLIVPFMKPKDKQRFLIQARSCLSHDAWDYIDKITVPTLIVAGGQDKIVTCQASLEMAEKIDKSELIVYENYGHSLYEEAKDFNSKIIKFVKKAD